MAIQINTTYTGRTEDLIYYERLGDYLIRTVQKQTAATKRAAKDLGRASGLAKNLRLSLTPIISDPRDRKMQNKLTGAVGRFLASTEKQTFTDLQNNSLVGFRFTACSALNECLLFPLNITEDAEGKISIGIPAINPVEAIVAPESTTVVEITLMAATVHPDQELALASGPASISIPYSNGLTAPRTVELQAGIEPGSVIIIAAALSYWRGSEQIRQPGFMPVEIVAAGSSVS